jgi:dihydroneopterin aldolase
MIAMLTVSLHGIKIQSAYGLYPQELILGNEFEVDVDVFVAAGSSGPWPFVDYTIIREIVAGAFQQHEHLLENLVREIQTLLRERFDGVEKVKVAVRKLHPPMEGEVGFAQVCFEG